MWRSGACWGRARQALELALGLLVPGLLGQVDGVELLPQLVDLAHAGVASPISSWISRMASAQHALAFRFGSISDSASDWSLSSVRWVSAIVTSRSRCPFDALEPLASDRSSDSRAIFSSGGSGRVEATTSASRPGLGMPDDEGSSTRPGSRRADRSRAGRARRRSARRSSSGRANRSRSPSWRRGACAGRARVRRAARDACAPRRRPPPACRCAARRRRAIRARSQATGKRSSARGSSVAASRWVSHDEKAPLSPPPRERRQRLRAADLRGGW